MSVPETPRTCTLEVRQNGAMRCIAVTGVGKPGERIDLIEKVPVGAERERMLDAFEAIMVAESGAGRLSGPKGIAVEAVNQAVPILYAAGRLTDADIAVLERRGSLGVDAEDAIALLREHDRLSGEEGS